MQNEVLKKSYAKASVGGLSFINEKSKLLSTLNNYLSVIEIFLKCIIHLCQHRQKDFLAQDKF